MHLSARRLFPYGALLLGVGALVWTISFGTLPPAEFTFINGTEIQSVDPARVTGAPEGRIINAIFEGLYRMLPSDDDPTVLVPQPALAQSHQLSEDRRTYTFTINQAARWSDGTPGTSVTAHDFVWSWRRFLHPETGSEYAYQLYYVKNAQRYNAGKVKVGDSVEVELANRPDANQLYPRGTLLGGILRQIEKGPKPTFSKSTAKKDQDRKLADWRLQWVYVVEVKPEAEGRIDWDRVGTSRRFCKEPAPGKSTVSKNIKNVEKCRHVLLHFDSQVGIQAPGDHTLVVTLDNPTPYFLDLVAFYPLYPVNRRCVEKYGTPNWTKPGNIVTSGPFLMKLRRIRDRIRLVKNRGYWNAAKVKLNVIDALAVNSVTTNLNMYMNGQADWIITVPNAMIPILKKRDDFVSAPMLTTYFYRLNVTRKPLDDARVRRALNMAIDKREICQAVLRGGQQPALGLVPPGLAGYQQVAGGDTNVPEARRLLAEAGYAGGRNFRKIQILYNTLEAHRDIAEVIQRQWKNNLGIDVELKNLEWGVYLDAVKSGQYDVARAGWIGDYPDPNTFLDMFVTGGANNQTGWGNPQYDRLIRDSAAEPDRQQRLQMLHEAEQILMREQPIIPIYFYVSTNMARTYVKRFTPNIQDLHPLLILEVDQAEKQRVLQAEGRR